MGSHLYVYGHYEDSVSRAFEELLRPGDYAVDVGANIGYFTLLAAHRVGSSGRVDAFEASPSTRERLESNLRLNQCDVVTVHACGAGAEEGTLQLHCGPDHHSGVTSLRDLGKSTSSTVAVPIRRVDDLVSKTTPVRLMKIDVEGAEMMVLKGATETLRRDRPFLIIELTDTFLRQLGSSSAEVCDFLRAEDYTLLRLDWDATVRLDQAPADQINIVACPPESSPSVTQIMTDLSI